MSKMELRNTVEMTLGGELEKSVLLKGEGYRKNRKDRMKAYDRGKKENTAGRDDR